MRFSPFDQVKFNMAMAPASKAAATYAQTGQDISGFDYYLAKLILGAITATGTLVFKLQECDTLAGTYVDITGATVTLADTDGDKMYMHLIDCRLRKRFVRAHLVVGVAASIAAIEEQLSVAYELPVTQPATTIKSSTTENA
jgi:hypothetical protein